MPLVAQVRRVIFNDEEIGMGFNSQSGLAVGTALEGFQLQEPTASGQEVVASISIVTTHEELMEQLGMSFAAQGRYGFFTASAKASFAESSNFNSTSTFIVARCVVQNPMTRGRGFTLTHDAAALLDPANIDRFKQAFGDSFVRGLQTGGEFYAVTRITSTSVATQSALSASLHAAYNGLVTSVEFDAEFQKAKSSASTSTEITATMYQKAGSGTTIAPTIETADVIARFKSFPTIAKENPVAYETEVATYDTIPIPVTTPDETDAFLFALRDAREKKLRYLQSRNDMDFAFRNPAFFVELPDPAVLRSAVDTYTKLINAVMEHAIVLSRGEMDPPQAFDPSALTPPIVEPAPIELKRAPDKAAAATVRVPNFVGIDALDINGSLQCLSAFSPEACRTGMDENGVGIGQDDDVRPSPVQSVEVWDFLNLVEHQSMGLKIEPPEAEALPDNEFSPVFVVTAQFPAAGEMIAPDGEVVVQCTPRAP